MKKLLAIILIVLAIAFLLIMRPVKAASFYLWNTTGSMQIVYDPLSPDQFHYAAAIGGSGTLQQTVNIPIAGRYGFTVRCQGNAILTLDQGTLHQSITCGGATSWTVVSILAADLSIGAASVSASLNNGDKVDQFCLWSSGQCPNDTIVSNYSFEQDAPLPSTPTPQPTPTCTPKGHSGKCK